MDSTAESRQSNLELFRIITMLHIIAHHYVVNSGLTYANGPIPSNPLAFRSIFLLLLGAWGKTGINCFVILSGYFMCQKHISPKKYARLVFEVTFYKVLITIIFWVSHYEPFTLHTLIRTVLPVTELGTGFTSAYFVFYLFIPFLNILIHHLDEKQHIRLIALLSFMYVFLGTFKPLFNVTMNYVSWFVALYIMSSYVRMYHKDIYEQKSIWLHGSIACLSLSALSVIACTWISFKSGENFFYFFVSDCNSLLPVATSFSLFMLFRLLKIPQSKVINTIASSIFGVLCIHANSDIMRRWLWEDVFKNVLYYFSPYGYLHPLIVVPLVFFICSFIDITRIIFLEKPFLKTIDKHINHWTITLERIEYRLLDKKDSS